MKFWKSSQKLPKLKWLARHPPSAVTADILEDDALVFWGYGLKGVRSFHNKGILMPQSNKVKFLITKLWKNPLLARAASAGALEVVQALLEVGCLESFSRESHGSWCSHPLLCFRDWNPKIVDS